MDERFGISEWESEVDVAGKTVRHDRLDNFSAREQVWASGPVADDTTMSVDQVEVGVDEADIGIIDEALLFEADFVGVIEIVGVDQGCEIAAGFHHREVAVDFTALIGFVDFDREEPGVISLVLAKDLG